MRRLCCFHLEWWPAQESGIGVPDVDVPSPAALFLLPVDDVLYFDLSGGLSVGFDGEYSTPYFHRALARRHDIDRLERGGFSVGGSNHGRPEILDSFPAGDHRHAGRQDARAGGVDIIQGVKVPLTEDLSIEEVIGLRHGRANLLK